MINVDGKSLRILDVFSVAEHYEKVSLDNNAAEEIARNRKVLEKKLEAGEKLYGINTGFGKFFNVGIDRKDMLDLQNNLIRSHASGVGEPFSAEHVRAMMLVRANSLSKGFSGIRPVVVQTVIDSLNGKIHPFVPSIGSVGASGDLAPLAHIALSLMGEGRVLGQKENENSSALMSEKGIKQISFREKEGVAFINGTSTISGILSYELYRSYRLFNAALVASLLSFTALMGNLDAFSEWAIRTRPHPGQVFVSEKFNELIKGSTFMARNLQDPYSLRCIPQVYGAVLDTMDHAREVVEREINSVTDNPIVSEEGVVSAGNFHGEPVALVTDFLAIALTDLGNIMERRVARMVDSDLSGLPAFLTEKEGLQSGYMIPQYTAAALCNMNKVLSTPASADSIPTSANQEDHVSMGVTSANKLSKVVQNLYEIVSIELLLGAQALDMSEAKPSESIGKIHSLLRGIVPHLDADRPPYRDISVIRDSLLSGELGKHSDRLIESYR